MDATRLQTLDRGLLALKLIASAPSGVKISDIAKHLGVHRAIAYRIVATLQDHAMAFRQEDGRILPGSGVLLLLSQLNRTFVARARGILSELARDTGNSAFLSVADGEDGVAILTADPGDGILNLQYREGTRHPLSKGAAGLAILAGRAAREDDTSAVLEAREKGYSITAGQIQQGAVGLATWVPASQLALSPNEFSVGVVGLGALDESVTAARVLKAARELSQALA